MDHWGVQEGSRRRQGAHIVRRTIWDKFTTLEGFWGIASHLAHLEKKSGKFPRVILDIFSTFS